MSEAGIELDRLFEQVATRLEERQAALNEADPFNGNHGDHMVEIFNVASLAAKDKKGQPLAEAMEYASQLLSQYTQNGSAQVYARGLAEFARQFRQYDISMDELVGYTRDAAEQGRMSGGQASGASSPQMRAGGVLKALLSGLSAWQQAEAQSESATGSGAQEARSLDMGSLFEMGMSYLQAKQRGGSQYAILADAAVSASPLSKVPHRAESGKLAVEAFLQAMSERQE